MLIMTLIAAKKYSIRLSLFQGFECAEVIERKKADAAAGSASSNCPTSPLFTHDPDTPIVLGYSSDDMENTGMLWCINPLSS